MFGYVRPLRGELKVREYESFRSVYCGLCHSLKKNCGFAARFIVNYDLAFMAMLLSDADRPCITSKRCVASPLRKKKFHCGDAALDTAANYSVILSYWKLRDAVADEGFWSSLAARFFSLLLRRAYKRAAKSAPDFDALTRENLRRLAAMEEEKCPSLDRPADSFAKILESAAAEITDDARARAAGQIFYHVGRIVYILDAADDLEEDFTSGSYNPLIYRFNLETGAIDEETEKELRLTLRHSENMIISAFQLLDAGVWTEIIQNVVYLGIPAVTDAVLTGQWRKPKRNEL